MEGTNVLLHLLMWRDEGRLREEEIGVGFWSVGMQYEDTECQGRASRGR